MINYKEWKEQRHLSEANREVNSEIEDLIQSTAKEIAAAVDSHVEKMTPARSVPTAMAPPPAVTGPSSSGPFERLGRSVDDKGRAVINAPKSYINAPVKGNLPGEQPNPTRGSRLAYRTGLNASPNEDPNKPWYKKLASRLRNQFWMNKENIDINSIFSTKDLKEVLSSYGIKPLFLVEENNNFNSLVNTITEKLRSFVTQVNNLIKREPPTKPTATGDTVDSTASSYRSPERSAATPEAPPAADLIEVAKRSLKNKKSPLQAFLKELGANTDESKRDAIEKLVRKLGRPVRGNLSFDKVIDDVINNKAFTKKMIEILSAKPEPVPEEPVTSEPEPERSPPEEVRPKRNRSKSQLEFEKEFREPNPAEVRQLKRAPKDRDELSELLERLINDKVHPDAILSVNPNISGTLGTVLHTMGNKRLLKMATKLHM